MCIRDRSSTVLSLYFLLISLTSAVIAFSAYTNEPIYIGSFAFYCRFVLSDVRVARADAVRTVVAEPIVVPVVIVIIVPVVIVPIVIIVIVPVIIVVIVPIIIEMCIRDSKGTV